MEQHKEEQKEQEVILEIAELPKRIRGNHTKNFRKINIISNHYTVELKPINTIYIFSVRFTPQIPTDNSKLRNDIFSGIHSQVKKNINSPVFTGFNVYSINQPLSPNSQATQYKFKQYKVVIKQVKTIDLSTNPKLLLTFLNNGLRNIMNRLNFVEIGKSGKYFNSKDKCQIDNLFMYGGFKANFVMLQKGYFLRVDSVKKIVRSETVLQYIDQLYRIHKDKQRDERRSIVKNELIGKTVMSNYGKTLYYKIKDINYDQIGNIKMEEGKSLLSYYQQKYKITIQNLKQPLLVAENKKQDNSTLLIPELMLMTGIPDDFDQFRRKKISQKSIKNPEEKYHEIGKLMNELKTTQQIAALKDINISLKSSMVNLSGYVISSPILELGKKNTVDQGKQSFFNLFNKPIFASKHEVKLAIIYFKGTDMSCLKNTFQSTSVNLQVALKMNDFQIDGRPSIKLIQEQMKKAVDREYNICLIILPINLKTQYKDLKITALADLQIVTQVATDATMRKKNLQSVATKILLQIIAKRGNILWVPKPICKHEKMMQVGFDTAKVGQQTLLSICATINSTFSSIFSNTKVYSSNDNKFFQMTGLLLLAVESYFARNSCTPKQILIFTNSSTGDQIKTYIQHFAIPFTRKIKQIYTESEISTTLIMVSCKNSQRFFFSDGNNQQVRNVPAGTLIAEDLVSLNYDFFIISQQSIRGTAVPNHYKVIFSDSKLQEGVLQEIAFSQCFNYVNWTGSIKVPAILQYAKKCSQFNSEVMEKKIVPNNLCTRLYFI